MGRLHAFFGVRMRPACVQACAHAPCMRASVCACALHACKLVRMRRAHAHAPKTAPRSPRERSMTPQDRFMTRQGPPQIVPRSPRTALRWPQDLPRRPKTAPRWPQDRPRRPRRLQDGPKTPQELSKRPPKRPQEFPNNPRDARLAPRMHSCNAQPARGRSLRGGGGLRATRVLDPPPPA